jgi:transcriptional regulator with XRE-family HTH domain
MLAYDVDRRESDLDLERRRELRTFLLEHRARVTPVDIGLPRTSRRQVPGLRREEVAEVIGVTTDWYRAFESGRSVRVSPQFVSRLARALNLTGAQELTLFRLAFVEIYRL